MKKTFEMKMNFPRVIELFAYKHKRVGRKYTHVSFRQSFELSMMSTNDLLRHCFTILSRFFFSMLTSSRYRDEEGKKKKRNDRQARSRTRLVRLTAYKTRDIGRYYKRSFSVVFGKKKNSLVNFWQ